MSQAHTPIIATCDGTAVYTSRGQTIPMSGPDGRVAALVRACLEHSITQLWLVNYGAELVLPSADNPYGYDVQPQDPQSPWLHCFRRGTYGAVEIVRPALDVQSPWRDAHDARELLAALLLYRGLLGVAWHRSSGSTGAALLRRLHERAHATPLDLLGTPPPPARIGNTEAPMAWMRRREDDEIGMRYLHSYDKNGAYLGACAALEVGSGQWEHITDPDLINTHAPGYYLPVRLPGYYLVSGIHHDDAGVPAFTWPDYSRHNADGDAVWVTTPTLRFMMDRWTRCDVREAYVWHTHHRTLTTWYEVLRDTRETLQSGKHLPGMELARGAVKQTYAGMMGYLTSDKWDRSGDALYRPDIRHLIIATARCNLLRTVERVLREGGPCPLAIGGVDTLYYLSDEPDPVRALPPGMTLGTSLRDYKVKDAGVLVSGVSDIVQSALPPVRRLSALQDRLAGLRHTVEVPA